MTVVFMVLHILACVLLAVIILMQSGRGGGLTESFASAESMFGAQTNEVLIKATTVFASIFLVTCLSLAFLSTKKTQSLMAGKIAPQTETLPGLDLTLPVVEEVPEAPVVPLDFTQTAQ